MVNDFINKVETEFGERFLTLTFLFIRDREGLNTGPDDISIRTSNMGYGVPWIGLDDVGAIWFYYPLGINRIYKKSGGVQYTVGQWHSISVSSYAEGSTANIKHYEIFNIYLMSSFSPTWK